MAQVKTFARAFFKALDTLPEPPPLSFAQTAFEAFTGALGDTTEPREQVAAAARVARPPAKAEKQAAPVRRARKARTPRAQQTQTGNGATAAA